MRSKVRRVGRGAIFGRQRVLDQGQTRKTWLGWKFRCKGNWLDRGGMDCLGICFLVLMGPFFLCVLKDCFIQARDNSKLSDFRHGDTKSWRTLYVPRLFLCYICYMFLPKSCVLQRYVLMMSLEMISNLPRPHLLLRQICKAIVWCCMHVQKLGIAC